MSINAVGDGDAVQLRPPEWRLQLLGDFELTGPYTVRPGSACKRLLALLGVHAGALARWRAAQLLYPDGPDARAAANLRAVLWRMRRCCPPVLTNTMTEIRLAPGVTVDYWAAAESAQQLIRGTSTFEAAKLIALPVTLRHDLLPGWADPWLVPERELFHQLRLHALESLCARLTSCGRHGAAVDAGLAAVAADPLRESAQRALIEAHLAERNVSEAIRQYQAFHSHLQAELGLEPSGALRARLAPYLADAR